MPRKYNWIPFEQAFVLARLEAKANDIDSERKWNYFRKRNQNLPSHPDIVYKHAGWISWAHWLETNNIRGCIRKYNVNDSFFKTWSHDMAYILGFWWADGCMRFRSSWLFSISQHSKDSYILRDILKKMESDYPVFTPKTRKKSCIFEISSNEICLDIISLGGRPKKSLKISMPNVPFEFFQDFLRGVFDGDGSISMVKKNNHPSCYICSGSKSFLKGLQNKLFQYYGVCGKIKFYKTCFRLRFNIKEIIKLGEIMYQNNRCDIMKLHRKCEKFIDLFSHRGLTLNHTHVKQEKEAV